MIFQQYHAHNLTIPFWQIDPGQCWAVLGRNGSGKERLAQAILDRGKEPENAALRFAVVSFATQQAFFEALKQRGTASAFTALTMTVSVATWYFSDLKFQADMGILLAFMFLVNLFGAILLLPAISAVLFRSRKVSKPVTDDSEREYPENGVTGSFGEAVAGNQT